MHSIVGNLIKKTGERRAYDIAKSLGIDVEDADMPEHVNGFCTEILNCKFIVVNSHLEDWQKRAVVAHELGHIVLHPDYHYCCSDDRSWYRSAKLEKEADEFAVEMFRQLSTVNPNYVALFLGYGWK